MTTTHAEAVERGMRAFRHAGWTRRNRHFLATLSRDGVENTLTRLQEDADMSAAEAAQVRGWES